MKKRYSLYDERTSEIIFEDNSSVTCAEWANKQFAKGSIAYNSLWIIDNKKEKNSRRMKG